jgi:hypothetical protein
MKNAQIKFIIQQNITVHEYGLRQYHDSSSHKVRVIHDTWVHFSVILSRKLTTIRINNLNANAARILKITCSGLK